MPIIQSAAQPSFLDVNQRAFDNQQGLILNNGTFQVSSGVLHAVYLGRLSYPQAFGFVRFFVGTAGVGTQTAEIGIFSSPSAANRTNQTLTALTSGTVGSLTATGLNANSSTFSGTTIAAGTHIWVGIRVVMGTTQPILSGAYAGDWAAGASLQLAASGAIVVNSTYAMGFVSNNLATVNVCPRLTLTLD